ncbi:MAG: succinylglutamate desuccinylase/aspartoacylase family protein [Geminicoccaceae bacterium]
MAKPTRIWTDVDYAKPGKQVGWLSLPHSVTRSAYGNITIPIAVVNGGRGPTALFMAGNHGDEYEGQIALCRLIRELEPAAIQGRVIVLPAANLPAALDGARVSPIDQGNLNRSFPGDPDGTVTRQIAYYVDSVLFPLADHFHDFHSGGSSLDYLPFASMHYSDNEELNDRCLSALKAFGAPTSLIWMSSRDVRYAPPAAMARGVVALGGEFGGGGEVAIDGVALIARGLRNTMVHLGMLPAPSDPDPAPPSRLIQVPGRDYFVYAPEPGLFEPAVRLGDRVEAGQEAGRVHFVDNPARSPVPCHFKAGGMVICKRHYGRVERGDCVFHLAIEYPG